jgi:cytoskeleton protein RodZ
LKRPAGIDAGESRIVLRANADSWIEIQDDGGSVLLRQILRAGESYRVPNRAGLSLMTGNAGGIEVSVDGKPGRKMGPSGIARRNIPLDPDQLQSGAINE